MKRLAISNSTLATAVFLAVTLALSAAANAKDSRSRFQCKASGASDISMSARYEIRDGSRIRRKFSTEFEAGPGTGFRAGNKFKVVVQGTKVGTMKLENLAGGDVVGDLNFDTRRQQDAKPFPANWPNTAGRGSEIEVRRGSKRVLGCTLS